MRTALVIAAVICGILATALGFGWVDDPDHVEDVLGWLSLAVTLFAASFLPWERVQR